MPSSPPKPLFHLLLQSTHLQNLKLGTSLHAHVIKIGSWHDIFLANSIVNLYAKCHQFHQAHSAFSQMVHRDVVSYNSLINSLSQQGPPWSITVLNLFKRMQTDDYMTVIPNGFTFSGVFTAAALLPELRSSGGREAHCVAVKTGNVGDVFVGSSLLNLYCKLGFVEDGRKVFDRMPERNTVSWAAMVTGYAGEKRGAEAFGLFRLMVGDENECRPNEFVITSVLSAVSAPKFVRMGRQVHGFVIKNGLVSFVTVENSLVTLYSKCECLDDAALMFVSSGDKSPITWSAMVTGYAQNSEPEKALVLFSRMQLEGVRPTEFTFVGVLNACSDRMALLKGEQIHTYLVKLGFELQVYIKSALVDMYAKCGKIDSAKKGFGQLNMLCEADTVLWTTMIGGYVNNGEHEEAFALFRTMQKQCVMPNNLTIVTILRACSCLAALEQGKQVHALALKYGFGLGLPLGSSLSTMYAKSGDLEDCSLVFRRMPQRDSVAWNAVISGFSQNGRGMEALDLFEEMKLEGTQPDHVTFINLLFACSHMGLVERGWDYFRSMYKDYGLVPKVDHYACMVDILSRAGLLEEATNFIETVPINHGTCLWRIVLGACRTSKNFDVGAYAGEQLMELGTRDSSAYILLSNIYASQRKWDNVERVRRLMRIRGVNKEPGCSWVELQNRVHVFVAGEHLHPEISDIYEEVRRLRKHMKDEGYHFPYPDHGLQELELDAESYSKEELPSSASVDI